MKSIFTTFQINFLEALRLLLTLRRILRRCVIKSRSIVHRFAYEAERNGRLSRIKTNELIVVDRRSDGYREYRVPGRAAGTCSRASCEIAHETLRRRPYSHAKIGVHVLTHARSCVQRMSAYGNDRPRNADQAPAEALRRCSYRAR